MPSIEIVDLSGGLWIPGEAAPTTEQPGFAIPNNALLRCDNVDFLPSGGVMGRRGAQKQNGAAPAAGEIRALHRFLVRAYTRTSAPVDVVDGAASNDAIGTVAWLNPLNLLVSGSASANFEDGSSGTVSNYLVRYMRLIEGAEGIPANAAVTGIRARVSCIVSSGSLVDSSVRIYDPNNAAGLGVGFVGSEQAGASTIIPADGFVGLEYGGIADDWGLGAGLSPAFVNDPGWGIGISFTTSTAGANLIRVFGVTITVDFTAPPVSETVVVVLNGSNLEYSRLAGGALSVVTGGVVVAPVLPLGRPRLLNWPEKQKSFAFDGANTPRQICVNGAGDVETSPLVTIVGLPPPEGPFAALHQNRLFANRQGESSTIYACDILNEQYWPPQAAVSCNDPQGGQLTGLASYTTQDLARLVIFKDTGLWSLTGDIEFSARLAPYDVREGCVAPDTVQSTPFGVIYLARSGVRITDGATSVAVSDQIKSLFRSRSTQVEYPNAVGLWFPRRNQYWLKLDPATDPGYILHRVMLPGVGDIFTWSRIPILDMNCGVVEETSGDDGDLLVGDTAGFVWTRDVGADDDGVLYAVALVTGQRPFSPQLQEARVYEIYCLFRGKHRVSSNVRYDQSTVDLAELGASLGEDLATPTYQEARRYITDKSHFGRFVSWSMIVPGSADFELHRVELVYERRSRRVWR
jgi:hypothetical protein